PATERDRTSDGRGLCRSREAAPHRRPLEVAIRGRRPETLTYMMTAWETRGVRFRPTLLVLTVALTMVLGSEALAKKKKAPPLCATVSSKAHAPVLAILSAFPAELVPLVAATTVEETIQIGAKSFYRGRMGGVHVVLG